MNIFLHSCSITYDDVTGRFTTKAPIWFDPSESNSLAYWVIFYLEIALWVHYMAYIRGQFRGADNLNKNVFIKREKQYINLKEEIGAFWENVAKAGDERFIKDIADEIFKRSLKNNTLSTSISSDIS